MTRRSFGWGLVLAASMAWFASGCGGSGSNTPQPVENLALDEVGTLYQAYTDQYKKPPQKPTDFARFEQGYPLGYRLVKEGGIVVEWGATLGEGSKDKVLAYEKKVPQEGGAVLMGDRSLRTMTADEFKSAPRASGS